MSRLICGEKVGERKAVLTKYALICHTVVNIAYLVACTYTGTAIAETFSMWLAGGYTTICGGSFWANAIEHKANAKPEAEK